MVMVLSSWHEPLRLESSLSSFDEWHAEQRPAAADLWTKPINLSLWSTHIYSVQDLMSPFNNTQPDIHLIIPWGKKTELTEMVYLPSDKRPSQC